MQLAQRSAVAVVLVAAIASYAAAQQQAQNSSAPAPKAAPRNPEQYPPGPPAEIIELKAEPSSIKPGQSATLVWRAVNSDNIYFNECLGFVSAIGSRKVAPSATTTYTLTAKGESGGQTRSITVKVDGTTPAPPKTAPGCVNPNDKPIPQLDGHPDLSGVYIAGFDVHPDPETPIVLNPGAQKYRVGTDYGFSLTERCLPPGIPGTTQWPYPLQIVETPKQVVILYEAEHLFRVIPTDGRPHPKDLDPTWMGDSVGHWDGNTLVVDVTGFNDKGYVDAYRHTTAYHVIERYRRTAYDSVSYEATIEDPNVFAKPWKMVGILHLHPEWQIQEYICEENNHNYDSLFNQFGGHN